MLKKQPADDLFEKSSMSFGEHLEELRKALGKALLWLGIGAAIGLVFAEKIVHFIEKPLRLAISDFYVNQAKEQFKLANGIEPTQEMAEWITLNEIMPERVFIDPASITALPQESSKTNSVNDMSSGTQPAARQSAAREPVKESPATEEPAESPAVASEAMNADAEAGGEGGARSDPATKSESSSSPQVTEKSTSIAIPETNDRNFNPWKGIDFAKLRRLEPFLLWRPIPNKLVSLTVTEGFMIWLKAGLVAGVVIGSPGIFWHIWQFLAAGLYPHERRYVFWYLPLSLVLFLAGVCLAFFVVFRLVLGFLMTYTTGLNVEFTPRLNDYMSFALFLPLGFGIAFQLPILMLGLHRFGLVSVATFVAQWRLAVLVIAFLSMLLTPADIYSMLGLFVPLVGLYFFGILLCHYMPQGAGIGGPALDPKG
jgi:sec-independent protein translocase protein TatC